MPHAPEVPDRIERELGSTEAVFWLLDRLYCLNVVVYAELAGALDAKRLRAGLAVVQDENPLLRARIAPVGGQPRFQPVPAKQAPLQLDTLPLRGWRAGIEQLVQRRFDATRAPLARFLWFKGAGRKSVAAICFQHAIADGRSGLAVLFGVLRRATVDAAGPPRYKAARPSTGSCRAARPGTSASLARASAGRGRSRLMPSTAA